MKNMKVLYGVLAVLLLVTAVVVYNVALAPKPQQQTTEETVPSETVSEIDPSIVVDLIESKAKANTVIISAKGLGSKIASVDYELSYESQGLIKGVNSGSKPIDTTGKDSFEREVYLGTCSRNDCRPDVGVTKVSLVLEFTDTEGKRSQFSKDYDL